MNIVGAYNGGTAKNWYRRMGKQEILKAAFGVITEQWRTNRNLKQLSFRDAYMIAENQLYLLSRLTGIWQELDSYKYGYELTNNSLTIKIPSEILKFMLY